MIQRAIIEIDQQKCDGCGQCVPGCEEGAIRIVEGKARLISDVFCDGLGACLGHCPQGAISLIERPAEPFSEAAVAAQRTQSRPGLPLLSEPPGCPGSHARRLPAAASEPQSSSASRASADETAEPSRLANWPVQLRLVPPQADYLRHADLLLAADCVPFAMADFHRRLLAGRAVLIGCPKLDDAAFYVHKLAQVLRAAQPRSLTVVHMEVPCCTGLAQIARAATELAAANLPIREIVVKLDGQLSIRPDSR